MFYTRLIRQFKLLRIRQLHSTFVRNENKSVSEKPKTTETSKSSGEKQKVDFVTGISYISLTLMFLILSKIYEKLWHFRTTYGCSI